MNIYRPLSSEVSSFKSENAFIDIIVTASFQISKSIFEKKKSQSLMKIVILKMWILVSHATFKGERKAGVFAICVAIALVPACLLIVGVRLPPCGHSANNTKITSTACDLSVQKAHLSFPSN